jgi:hypothetical protein
MRPDGPPRFDMARQLRLLEAAACDWRLARGDVGVLAVVAKHADAQGRAFPGRARIAAMARMSVRNVTFALSKLERLGYVRVDRPGRPRRNTYELQAPPPVPDRWDMEAPFQLPEPDSEAGFTLREGSGKGSGLPQVVKAPSLDVRKAASHELTTELTTELTARTRAQPGMEGTGQRHQARRRGESMVDAAARRARAILNRQH